MGYHGDCSETFGVGNVNESGKQLVKVTHDAWQAAIAYCRPGMPYNGIGEVIQDYVERRGYSSAPGGIFTAHGIGKVFHENPFISHTRNSEEGNMEVGHTFTIEPIICEGSPKHIMWNDNWTITTKDGKRAAQFEHTLLVTENGVELLTARRQDSPDFWWEV